MRKRMSFAAVILALSTAMAAAETESVEVKANKTSAIGSFASYSSATCGHGTIPDVTIRTQPANGRIEIKQEQWRISKGPCEGSPVRGLAYYYTPKRGFKGADKVSIDVPWSPYVDGGPSTMQTYTFEITVQ